MQKYFKLGLFGGSFNPPHKAHFEVAKFALKKLKLNYIFWLVVPENPFKKGKKYLSQKSRISLCNKNFPKFSKMKAIDFESDLKSFETCHTIKKAKKVFQNSKLFWIMGSDNLFEFHKWKKSDFILQNIKIAVYQRGNFHAAVRTKTCIKNKKKIEFLFARKMNESSTDIRKKLGNEWQKNYMP